jgi:hypothetical protein
LSIALPPWIPALRFAPAGMTTRGVIRGRCVLRDAAAIYAGCFSVIPAEAQRRAGIQSGGLDLCLRAA